MKKKKKLAAAACFVSGSILFMHMLNKFIFYMASKNEKLYSGASSYYKWRYGRVYYTKKGSGKPLLLIHDLNCTSSGYEWNEITNELSKTHTVFTVDLPGCGRSDKPELLYTAYFYVSFLIDFCRDIMKEKVSIAATGRSACLALMAAYMEPDLFNRIVLVNPTAPDRNSPSFMKVIYSLPVLGTFLYHCSVCFCRIKRTFREEYFMDSHRIKNKSVLAYREAAHLHGASSRFLFLSIRCGYINTPVLHALPEIKQRVTILSGQNRPEAEPVFQQYKKYLSNAEQRLISHSSGLPQLERPEEFLKELTASLQA